MNVLVIQRYKLIRLLHRYFFGEIIFVAPMDHRQNGSHARSGCCWLRFQQSDFTEIRIRL